MYRTSFILAKIWGNLVRNCREEIIPLLLLKNFILIFCTYDSNEKRL